MRFFVLINYKVVEDIDDESVYCVFVFNNVRIDICYEDFIVIKRKGKM